MSVHLFYIELSKLIIRKSLLIYIIIVKKETLRVLTTYIELLMIVVGHVKRKGSIICRG